MMFQNSIFILFLVVVGRLAEDVVMDTVVSTTQDAVVITNTCQQQENLLASCTIENNGYRSKVTSLENQLQQMTDTLSESQSQSQALRTMHTDLMKSFTDDSELLRKQLSSLEIQLQQATDALAKSQSQDQNKEDDNDDASLLELLVKSAKGKLLSSVPPTDKECKFDWVIGKCTPMCRCQFRPQWGDYSPSRACRLNVPYTGEEVIAGHDQCDDETKERPWAVKLAEEGRYHAEKIAKEAHHHIQQGARQVLAKLREVAPPTDDDCTFSLQSLRCEPLDLCVWDFQVGDFSPHRACRHKLTADGEQDFVL